MKKMLPLAAGLLLIAAGLFSQPSAITRTIVSRADVSVPGREAVIVRVEIAPEGRAGRHTHPGEEITYVLEGDGEILIDGKPALPVKTGSGFVVPAGAKHDAHNLGKTPMKLVAIYYVEKGQPLATPAP
jgi:quercetin dioxygenase-like cupin family protein